MAEGAVFSLASKLLSAVASPTLEKAYERVCSIRDARDDLDKLRRSIQTIQAVLLDAEKRQEAAVKEWVKRVKDVLYEADDLFDKVANDDILRQPIPHESKLLQKVRVSWSKLNSIISRDSIAKEVKAIRKSLAEISTDMAQFGFVTCHNEERISSVRKGRDIGSFVDSKDVFGRDVDKKSILEVLLNESNRDEQDVSVIAIVGIGGMGKTTLAQLVYSDEEVQKRFENKWFSCISDISDDEEVLGKIFQSISGNKYNNFTVNQLQSRIREFVLGSNNFLLVLDDVWDVDHARWQGLMRLLCGGTKGSKIIVTTRSLSVARSVDASKTHKLEGLSEDESWALFQRVAFTPEQLNDSRWTDLGREIVKKCANVPLAIKSIGSLLHTKATIQEWESFRHEKLAKLGQSGQNHVMSVLKLSYDHLHSNLKQCFAYCSLFPKDHYMSKQELIYLWVAQGYIQPNSEEQTVEEVGHSYFMDLLRMCFFQVVDSDGFGEIKRCKMHDLIHDLAQQMAGEECILSTTPTNGLKGTRHVSVGCVTDDSSANLAPLLNSNRLRSLLITGAGSTRGLALDHQFAKLEFLRALSLSHLGIENVPSSIGDLKHLRYLDISRNKFKSLPNSVTKLLNLCTLKIFMCNNLEALPNDLRKLINLRHLIIWGCVQLKHMPPGFGELTCLQHLDEFKVCRGRGGSKLDELLGLKLRGELKISFEDDPYDHDWDGDERWRPSLNLQGLHIINYQGMRMPHLAESESAPLLPNLAHLHLIGCARVKYLPSLRHLPNLKLLRLYNLKELEYIEEEEGGSLITVLSFPYLETLELWALPKLKGWLTKVDDIASNLEWPMLPRLIFLSLRSVNVKVIQLLSSPCLEQVVINSCDGLTSFPGQSLTSLRHLFIEDCRLMMGVKLAPSHLNVLETLYLEGCPELELWEQEKRGVDWDSLPILQKLVIDQIPPPERLPICLLNRQALGHLKIRCPNQIGADKSILVIMAGEMAPTELRRPRRAET